MAGGQSSRMGSNKALLEWQGKSLLQHALDKVAHITNETFIVTNELTHPSIPTYPDLIPNAGPVGGIHTALDRSLSEYLLVLACDMPLVSQGLLLYLKQHIDPKYDAIIPVFYESIEPLCAIYHSGCAKAFETCIDVGQLKLSTIASELRTLYLPITDDLPFYSRNLFFNVNTPADLRKLKEMSNE